MYLGYTYGISLNTIIKLMLICMYLGYTYGISLMVFILFLYSFMIFASKRKTDTLSG